MLLPVCHVVCLAQHWDYFFHEGGTANGGNRYATVLMYLYDVEEGGETVRGEGGGGDLMLWRREQHEWKGGDPGLTPALKP